MKKNRKLDVRKGRVSARKNRAGKGFSIESAIGRIDTSNLKEDFDSWPAFAREAYESTISPSVARMPCSVVITGMGGSGVVGELIADLASESGSNIEIRAVKDYHLPKDIDESSVVVGVSCSGNTEETLSVLQEAAARGLSGVTFGTGGLLEQFSIKNPGFPFVKTRMQKVPRSSLPGLFFPVLKFFLENKIFSLGEGDVQEAFDALAMVQEDCADKGEQSNKSLAIAKNLVSRQPAFPLIYASKRTRAVGMRFRQSLSENAKTHAFDGVIPELCHNDVVGWDADASVEGRKSRSKSLSEPYVPILLSLEDDPDELQTRFEIVSDIVSRTTKKSAIHAPYSGQSYLARIISMLYWLDYATYYTAVLRGINPIGTPSIDYLKHELTSRLNYLKRFA